MSPVPRTSRRRAAIVTFIAALVLALPVGVLASHQFGDVPDSNPFHADIDAVADAGVTGGCGGGNYCPNANVARGQMAAFLGRGLSRAGMSTALLDPAIVRTDGFVTIAAVTIEVGAVSGNQFVQVQGEVTAAGILTGCADSCFVNARLRDAGTGSISSVAFYRFPEVGVSEQMVVGKSWVFSAGAGDHTYQLQVAVFTTDDALGLFNPTVIATTHAFGSQGGSTLSLTEADGASTESTSGAARDAVGE